MSDDDKSPRPSLLPVNSSLLEMGLEQAFAKLLDGIDPPFPQLFDPDQTPVEFLPYLATDRGVEDWWSEAPELEKRGLIKRAWQTKRLAGTKVALENALIGLGIEPLVTPWHEQSPPGKPYSFKVFGWISRPYSEDMDSRLTRRMEAAKSERDSLDLSIGISTQTEQYKVSALHHAVHDTIFPLETTLLEQEAPRLSAIALNTADFTTIYPLQATQLEQPCTVFEAVVVVSLSDITTLYPLQETLLEQLVDPVYLAAGVDSGEHTTLYPLQITLLELESQELRATGVETAETTTIYPQEA